MSVLDADNSSDSGCGKDLVPGELDLWRIPLDRPQRDINDLLPLLHDDEVSRARAFHFERDHNHFIVARASLRIILGQYCDLQPVDVDFSYSSRGKPSLAVENPLDIRFNLSHSYGLALVGICRGRELGVDVELVRAGPAEESIAENYFTKHEVAKLRALPDEQRDEGFFACWTRKEAYLKARGDGLSLPLDHFEVTLSPDEPVLLRHIVRETSDERDWRLHAFVPQAGYLAAVVIEGKIERMRLLSR